MAIAPSTNPPQDTVVLDNYSAISARISSLQESISNALPGYESMLQKIHLELHKDPDVVQLLTEEQVGVIVAALAKRKGIILAEEKKKSASRASNKLPSGKKISEATIDDL